jgi:hypothetical protein
MIQQFIQELIHTFGFENFCQFKEGAELHNDIESISADSAIPPFPPNSEFPDTKDSIGTFTGHCTVDANQGCEDTPSSLQHLKQKRDNLLTERNALKQRLNLGEFPVSGHLGLLYNCRSPFTAFPHG